MSDGDQLIKEGQDWAVIVPNLLVSNLDRSADFYTRLCDFQVSLTEPERLVVIERGGEQIVLTQYRPDDPLVVAELTTPFGRGVSIHIRTKDPKPMYEALRAEKYPILVPMELAELQQGGERYTMTSFVVADPDGYLLRFSD